MLTTIAVWALWIEAGGKVNSGHLYQPYIAAYFATADECERVRKIFATNVKAQCIQARYISIEHLTKVEDAPVKEQSRPILLSIPNVGK